MEKYWKELVFATATQSERSRISERLRTFARVRDSRAWPRHGEHTSFLGRDEVVIVSLRRLELSILDRRYRVAERELRNLIVNKLLTRTNVLNKSEVFLRCACIE